MCDARLLGLEPLLRLHHVVGEGVLLRPLGRLARVEVGGRREQQVLKVGDVHLERVALAAHVDEDLDDLLDQLPVHHLPLALATHQLQDRRAHVALDRVEDNVVEGLRAHLGELGQREALDVEAVEVLEDVREEAHQQLVVLPPTHQLAKHRLVVLLADARQDARLQVVLDRLAVVVVQLLGPVVGRLLRAHRVHRPAARGTTDSTRSLTRPSRARHAGPHGRTTRPRTRHSPARCTGLTRDRHRRGTGAGGGCGEEALTCTAPSTRPC